MLTSCHVTFACLVCENKLRNPLADFVQEDVDWTLNTDCYYGQVNVPTYDNRGTGGLVAENLLTVSDRTIVGLEAHLTIEEWLPRKLKFPWCIPP